MNKTVKLSEQMSNLTKSKLGKANQYLIKKAKTLIKNTALNGRVSTVVSVYRTKTDYAFYRAEILSSFLKKEGFKVQKPQEKWYYKTKKDRKNR